MKGIVVQQQIFGSFGIVGHGTSEKYGRRPGHGHDGRVDQSSTTGFDDRACLSMLLQSFYQLCEWLRLDSQHRRDVRNAFFNCGKMALSYLVPHPSI